MTLFDYTLYMFTQRLQALNPAQRRAVETIEGPVLVIAGPGSGKTELLSMRVANILQQTDALPGNILCLTFTDAAAKNMRKRLQGLIGEAAFKVAIHTFHSFGRDIMNSFPEFFYGGAHMETAEELQTLEVLELLLKELPLKDPLRSFHPDQGFVYIKDIKSNISELKRAGVFPHELEQLLQQNELFLNEAAPLLQEHLSERVSKKSVQALPHFIAALQNIPSTVQAPWMTLKDLWISQLEEILHSDDPKMLTAWKKENTEKDAQNLLTAKDLSRLPRLISLAQIYEQYEEYMYNKGLVDFDDLLMETNKALEHHNELRYSLEEQYQYILVDEFQDTSGVQMRLLQNITSHPIHEGRPNILAVGDDDQSIFKFQGASLSNIIHYGKLYKDPSIIVLQENYRSTADILDIAEEIISKNTKRLTHHYDISKTQNSNSTKQGQISYIEVPTKYHEALEIGEKIKTLLAQGTPPSEIAVIARKHKDLQTCSEILTSSGVDHHYERQENIFALPVIRAIINILRAAHQLYTYKHIHDDSLLPEICAMPCFHIPQVDLWKLSLHAYAEKSPWLNIMLESECLPIKELGSFLLYLSVQASQKTVPELIDIVLGSAPCVYENNQTFTSPLRAYFFDHIDSNYIKHLEALERLFHHLSKKEAHATSLEEFIRMADNYSAYNIILPLNASWEQEQEKVQLFSAHKAKGLEFDHVFIIGVTEEQWITRGNSNKLPFPKNLPLSPAKDDHDDIRRLFFVALTRAKTHLYLTMPLQGDNGKEQTNLSYLHKDWIEQHLIPSSITVQNHVIEIEHSVFQRKTTLSKEESLILQERMLHFTLSPTTLTAFLDIIHNDPNEVITQTLLRFPSSPSPQMTYGNSIHRALHAFHMEYKKRVIPPLSFLLSSYDRILAKEQMIPEDREKYLPFGHEVLELYHAYFQENTPKDFLSEYNLAHEHIHIGSTPVSGTIDFMKLNQAERTLLITDFKTGKPLSHLGKQKDANKSMKAENYRLQLLFYATMLRHSKRYHNYAIEGGQIFFLNPQKEQLSMPRVSFTQEDYDFMEKLIKAAYTCFASFKAPNLENYKQTMKGREEFIQDILEM